MIELPFITIVMPVRNEARFIQDTLWQLLKQDYPADRFEILVVDGQSDDGTTRMVQKLSATHPQIRLIQNEKRLSSAGRNLGFQHGKGELFLVVDGHCYLPDDQLLRNVVRCFEESQADCLGRPQPLDPPGLTPFQQAVALARASRFGRSGSSLIYSDYEGYASPASNGAAYRRGVFDLIGLVDETIDACEDVEFNFRVEGAGLRAYTSPSLMVKYYPRENLRGLFHQLARYGQGRLRFLKKRPESLSVETFVPLGLVLCLALFFCTGSGVLGALIALYVGLVFFFSLQIARRWGWRHFGYLVAIYPVIHLGLGWGSLKEVTSSMRSLLYHYYDEKVSRRWRSGTLETSRFDE